MFTWPNVAPTALSARTAVAEKPHCGKSGVPFMYSNTGLAASCDLMRSMTSTFVYLGFDCDNPYRVDRRPTAKLQIARLAIRACYASLLPRAYYPGPTPLGGSAERPRAVELRDGRPPADSPRAFARGSSA